MRRVWPLAASLVLISLCGCHQAVVDPKNPKFVMAEVNGVAITRADLDNEVDLEIADAQANNPQLSRQTMGPAELIKAEQEALRGLVITQIMLQRAVRLNLPGIDDDVNAQLESLRSEAQIYQKSDTALEDDLKRRGHDIGWLQARLRKIVTIRKLLALEAYNDLQPSEGEIEAFYQKYQDKLTVPETMRASRVLLLVPDQATPSQLMEIHKKIEGALARVKAGEEFSKVAQDVSEDRYSGPRGGDMGYFKREENEEGFDAKVWNLPVGQLSPIFQTALGVQFVKVTDHQPAHKPPLADVRSRITDALIKIKQGQELQQYQTKILQSAQVVYHCLPIDDQADTTGEASATPSSSPQPEGPASPSPSDSSPISPASGTPSKP